MCLCCTCETVTFKLQMLHDAFYFSEENEGSKTPKQFQVQREKLPNSCHEKHFYSSRPQFDINQPLTL